MSKDVIRRTDIAKSKQTKIKQTSRKTEIEYAHDALTERLLFGPSARPQNDGIIRIILILDCTSAKGEYIESRKITPEAAESIAKLYTRGPAKVKLLFFRGDGSAECPRQLQWSEAWYATSEELVQAITAIEHWPGYTQHCAALRETLDEVKKQSVQAVIILTDAFERRTPRRPNGDDLATAKSYGAQFRELGVTLYGGYKGTIVGGCPFNRAGPGAEKALRGITDENGSYVFLFDPAGDPEQRGEHFVKIVTQARLSAQGDDDGAERLMLEHKQTIRFDMTVEERVPSARCASQSEEDEE